MDTPVHLDFIVTDLDGMVVRRRELLTGNRTDQSHSARSSFTESLAPNRRPRSQSGHRTSSGDEASGSNMVKSIAIVLALAVARVSHLDDVIVIIVDRFPENLVPRREVGIGLHFAQERRTNRGIGTANGSPQGKDRILRGEVRKAA